MKINRINESLGIGKMTAEILVAKIEGFETLMCT
jgi:hypothetical protein